MSETERTKILVVDDDPMACEALREILSSRGYEVIVARDGKEALDVIEKQGVEGLGLVLSDIFMPNVTGTELAEIIMRRNVNVPFVAMTGCDEDVEKLSELKASGAIRKLLKKPLDVKFLMELIEEIVTEGCKYEDRLNERQREKKTAMSEQVK